MAALGITQSGLQSQIERATRQYGDGLTLPNIGSKQLAAAKALSEPEQVALIKELAIAAKTIMMSPAFQAAHDAYIAEKHKAVNHGLKVKSGEQMLHQISSRGGAAEFELKMKRDMAAIYVQMAMETGIEDLKQMFDASLKEWTAEANKPKNSDRAKYAKLVKQAEAIKDLSVSNPDKFRRGYAVLRSAEADGLDTEEALFGAQASARKEAEQLAWDEHNLRGILKRKLSQVVAEAPTVDFAAQTVQKGSSKVFANPTYEKKSQSWKAMYRAGKGPAAAGLEIARAWLKEL
ncbi:MAG: hypothetical protein A2107_09295 [Verrucomicrobia bacterium GWF2_62_7]|nr:MAG: hypothetical protein A2107_09295 [Verrucomicrobia bacterium GWF2_62_7]